MYSPFYPDGPLTRTRVQFFSDIEIANGRLVAYIFTTIVAYNLYQDPGVFNEMFFHPHYPVQEPMAYNRGIPQDIIQANEVPMQQLEKLKATAIFLDSFKKLEEVEPSADAVAA